MAGYLWQMAVFAVSLNCTSAFAQDVTLTARDGGITLSGVLQGYDGEFYALQAADLLVFRATSVQLIGQR